jgi:hypothetical protein
MDAAELKDSAQHASRTVQENLAEGIGRAQGRVQERVRRGADQAQNVLASLNEEFGSFVRASPIVALGGAVAVGYLIARLARAFK